MKAGELLKYQQNLFDQMAVLKEKGDDSLAIPFSAGGHSLLIPAESVFAVDSNKEYIAVPSSPSWILGLTQFQGDVYTVFDLGALLSPHLKNTRSRKGRLIILKSEYAYGVALWVDQLFSSVPFSDFFEIDAEPEQEWVSHLLWLKEFQETEWSLIHPESFFQLSWFNPQQDFNNQEKGI